MPSKNNRATTRRGGGAQSTATTNATNAPSSSTAKSGKHSGSATTNTMTGSSASLVVANGYDLAHNSDQPCSQILTHVAQQIFPHTIFFPHAVTTATTESSHSNRCINSSISNDLPTLLREYMRNERNQRQSRNERMARRGGPLLAAEAHGSSPPSHKKRRKKKKKKKTASASAPWNGETSNRTTAAPNDDISNDDDDDDDDDDEEATLTLPGAASTAVLQPIEEDNEERRQTLSPNEIQSQPPSLPCMNTPIYSLNGGRETRKGTEDAEAFRKTTTSTFLKSDHGTRLLLQQERCRRIQTWADRFVHRQIGTAAILTPEEEDQVLSIAQQNLQPLHTFVNSNLTDRHDTSIDQENGDEVFTQSPTTTVETIRFQSQLPLTVIPMAKIQASIQAIQCLACRRDVELILLPPTATHQQHSLQQHQPLLLQGVSVPTVYDIYDDSANDDMAEQTFLQYQLLMEEGMKPPEHAYCWTIELLSSLSSSSDANTCLPTKTTPVTKSTPLPSNRASATSKTNHTAKNTVTTTSTTTTTFSSLQQRQMVGWHLQRPMVSRSTTTTTATTTSPTDVGSSNGFSGSEWSMAELEFLLHEYVVLLGLPPDVILGQQQHVTSSAISSVSESVGSKKTSIMNDFNQYMTELHRATEKFTKAKNQQQQQKQRISGGSNIEWKYFSQMKESDEACDTVLDNLLRIAMEVTQSVQTILTNIGGGVLIAANANGGDDDLPPSPWTRDDAIAESHWAVVQCAALWRVYLEGAHNIIMEVDKYEQQLFALADRKGNVPEMFINATARELYTSFVRFKISEVVRTMNRMDKRINHPTDVGGWSNSCGTNTKTTFLTRVLTEEAFYQVVSGLEKRPHLIKQPVDRACEDVLTTIREMTETVHQGNVDKFVKIHRQRHGKLSRLLAVVVDTINRITDEAGAKTVDYDEDENILKDFRQEMTTLGEIPLGAGRDHVPAVVPAEDLRDWQSRLLPGLVSAVERWITYRLHHNITGFDKSVPPTMPLALRRTMVQENGTNECKGGNGRHRSICILVGLFFERLCRAFKEWQAHLAAQELLTTILSDGDNSVAGQVVTKANKKAKKKTTKKMAPSDSTNEVSATVSGNSNMFAPVMRNASGDESSESPTKGRNENGQSLNGIVELAVIQSDELIEPTCAVLEKDESQSEVRPALVSNTITPSKDRNGSKNSNDVFDEKQNAGEPDKLQGSGSGIKVPNRLSNLIHSASNYLPSEGETHSPKRSANKKTGRESERRRSDKKLSIDTAKLSNQDSSDYTLNKVNFDNKKNSSSMPTHHFRGELLRDVNSLSMSKIGVYDRSGFVVAEAFFVGRLKALVDSGDDYAAII